MNLLYCYKVHVLLYYYKGGSQRNWRGSGDGYSQGVYMHLINK